MTGNQAPTAEQGGSYAESESKNTVSRTQCREEDYERVGESKYSSIHTKGRGGVAGPADLVGTCGGDGGGGGAELDVFEEPRRGSKRADGRTDEDVEDACVERGVDDGRVLKRGKLGGAEEGLRRITSLKTMTQEARRGYYTRPPGTRPDGADWRPAERRPGSPASVRRGSAGIQQHRPPSLSLPSAYRRAFDAAAKGGLQSATYFWNIMAMSK